ncbi:CxC2 domain-containing protein [Salix suchowensis]|nr:CxC2 domain-containing protein [Salix suchowensis]
MSRGISARRGELSCTPVRGQIKWRSYHLVEYHTTTAQSLPSPMPMEVFEDFPPIHALDDQLFGPVDREGLGLPTLGNMFSLDHAYLAHLADMDTDDVAVSRAPVRETYLEELARLEGLGNDTSPSMCPLCKVGLATARCRECLDTSLHCIQCVVNLHRRAPLHRIEVRNQNWNGDFFAPKSLKEFGLRIQLGHPCGQSCANPLPAFDNGFTIIDSLSVHSVSLDYCGCETAKLPIIQLLRHRLFPATSVAPRSAATFGALDHFHMLSLEGKLSAFEFWRALARTTDKTEIEPPRSARFYFHHPLTHLLLLRTDTNHS